MKRATKLPRWFCPSRTVYLTSQPPLPAAELDALLREGAELRSKLLMWAAPLASIGHFSEAAVARIREGAGHKDLASDLVALVGLYRGKWDAVRSICGVTEADLDRASVLGPNAFALVSRKEHALERAGAEDSLRLRRALTKLDRAYFQCRRAIAYLRATEGDVDEIAPNLRRNAGGSRAARSPVAPASPTVPAEGA